MQNSEDESKDLIKFQKTLKICYRVEGQLIISKSGSLFIINDDADTIDEVQFNAEKANQFELKRQNILEEVQFKEIYGIVELNKIIYLVLVTQHQLVGQIKDNKIYKVTKIETISLKKRQGLNSYEKYFKDSFSYLILYYSPTYDLSQRLQFQMEAPPFYVHHFMANYGLTLSHSRFPNQFLIIFITGLVQIYELHQEEKTVKISLISRGNCKRLGRRWFRRGIDDQGNVAVHYQTETICQFSCQQTMAVYSHVQIRGSIPLYWSQTPKLTVNTSFKISSDQGKNQQSFTKYLNRLKDHEGKVLLLNLIDQSGKEGQIGMKLSQMFQTALVPETNYVWFDFHKNYAEKKQQSFINLIQDIKQYINNFGYFSASKSRTDYQFTVSTRQTGTIRTNCVDCLDRTNFIQSLIAKIMIHKIYALEHKEVYEIGSPFTSFVNLQIDSVLKNLWKSNARAISLQYCGSLAMKADFLLNDEKRSWNGYLNDASIGCVRFYNNNFADYYIQNCLDLHFGRIKINQQTNFTGKRDKSIKLFSAVVGASICASLPWSIPLLFKENVAQKQDRKWWQIGISVAIVLTSTKLIQVFSDSFLQLPENTQNI